MVTAAALCMFVYTVFGFSQTDFDCLRSTDTEVDNEGEEWTEATKKARETVE